MYNFGEVSDTFCEQLVTMPKDGKYYVKFFGIWLIGLLTTFGLVMTGLRIAQWFPVIFVLITAVFFIASKLSARLFTEYEYIVVNKDLDIDKISGKSNRKRLITIKLTDVEELGVYNSEAANKLSTRKFDETVYCASPYEECYYIVARHQKRGNILLVASFNEKLLAGVKHSVPRLSQKI